MDPDPQHCFFYAFPYYLFTCGVGGWVPYLLPPGHSPRSHCCVYVIILVWEIVKNTTLLWTCRERGKVGTLSANFGEKTALFSKMSAKRVRGGAEVIMSARKSLHHAFPLIKARFWKLILELPLTTELSQLQNFAALTCDLT